MARLRFLSYDTTLDDDIKTKFTAYQGSRRRSKRKSETTIKKGGTSTKTSLEPVAAPLPEMDSVATAHLNPGPSSVSVGFATQIGPGMQKEEEHDGGATLKGGDYLSPASDEGHELEGQLAYP